MRQWPARLEATVNSLCRLLSLFLRFLPERFSLRLSRVRLIKRAALRNLGDKWNKDRSRFNPNGRGKVIKMAYVNPGAAGQSPPVIQASPPDYMILQGPNKPLAERRIALMAHFDPHNVVDPYVLNYLRHLRAIGYEPVLATCGGLSLTPELENLLLAAVARLGPGYDFTSWQAAFNAFPELLTAKELLLCNDSIFAPIGSFLPIHERMEAVPCDFWGLCESRQINQHLQSYYMVFKKSALLSPAFKGFWDSLRVGNREEAIAAELGLASTLAHEGLVPGAYINSECLPLNTVSPIHLFWRPLIEWFDIPCLKRNLLQAGLSWLDIRNWRDLVADKGYDLSLIDNYYARIGNRIQAKPQ